MIDNIFLKNSMIFQYTLFTRYFYSTSIFLENRSLHNFVHEKKKKKKIKDLKNPRRVSYFSLGTSLVNQGYGQ